jgi:pyrimidine-nucleoside phosphorylase
VTGTVQSIPLIASSVMSKKIASGAQVILLDVKIGNGAFMKNLEDARTLAVLMVEIGKQLERKTAALLSDMNQPLGTAVGNALELKEAIETLKGGGAPDFVEHCLVVAGYLLAMGGKAPDAKVGYKLAENALKLGKGLDLLRKMIQAQGGDVLYIDEPERLPGARLVEDVKAPRSGWLKGVHARLVGESAVLLGGGREKKEDKIDYGVGILVHKKVGDKVEAGDVLFTIYANDADKSAFAYSRLLEAVQWSDEAVDPLPLFYGLID